MRGRVAEVQERGQKPVNEDQLLLCPGADGPFLARDASMAWCRACHNGPTSTTSSAITSGDRPVIRRSLMIAARDAFPTTQP